MRIHATAGDTHTVLGLYDELTWHLAVINQTPEPATQLAEQTAHQPAPPAGGIGDRH